MEFHLFVSYKPLKNPSGHPSQIRLKFKAVGYIASSDLKTDSIGGPKSTLLQLIPDESIPKHKVSRRHVESFRVEEVKNTYSSLIPISKVSWKFSVSRPLGSVCDDTKGQNDLFYDPKLDLTVYAADKSLPIMWITEEMIRPKTLFCEQNLFWFKALMGPQLSLEVVFAHGMFAYKTGEGTPFTPIGQICSNNVISLLQLFICKGLPAEKAPLASLVLKAPEFKTLIRDHMQDRVDRYDSACLLLKDQIPRLEGNKQGPDFDSLLESIQDNVRVLYDFLSDCTEIPGVGGAIRKAASSRSKVCTKFREFKNALRQSNNNSCFWNSEHESSITIEKMEDYKLLEKELPYDLVASISSMMSSRERSLPNLKGSTITDIAMFSLMGAILRGSQDFGLKISGLYKRIVSKLVERTKSLSAHVNEYDKGLHFASGFVYKLDKDILRVWPRSQNPQNPIDSKAEVPIPFFKGRDPRYLMLLGNSKTFVLVKEVDNQRIVILDIMKYLAGITIIVDVIATVSAAETKKKRLYCLDSTYLYMLVANEVSQSTEVEVVPLKKTTRTMQLNLKTEVSIPYQVTTAFASHEQRHLFVASLDQLSCWSWSSDNLEQIADCKLDTPLIDSPQSSESSENLSQIKCLNFRPIFFESRRKVYYLRILNSDYLQLYGFYRNQFILVTKGKGNCYKPPPGYVWLSDTSGNKTTLYAAKQIYSDPKTFRIGKLLLS